ncbi:response regulator [Aquimarina sp. 2201CG1-2-11]|uniref:response regulator n=1 Tax=Aquimarina discodermiae TaxID=3231043 RepID=UPI0034617BA6
MGKTKQFLLVDDSEATNFFNKMMIQKTGYADEILIAKNGEEALDYIKSGIFPSVIFLDINMPVMNGWEFLTAYQKLSSEFKKSKIVLMIGAELINGDKKMAEEMPDIITHSPKHLTKELITKVVEEYLYEEYDFS